MSIDTKQRILETSVELFNRFGFVSVRLQHIADEVGLSVGNLAYHYKNKDAIVDAIYEELEKEQHQLLSDLRIVPLFVNIEKHLYNTYLIQQKYSFFFADMLEVMRAFPIIKKKHRIHTQWFISQIEMMLTFNIARGALVSEPLNEILTETALHYWSATNLWLYQNKIKGIVKAPSDDYIKSVWALLMPFFTDIGKREYAQRNFNENYNWL